MIKFALIAVAIMLLAACLTQQPGLLVPKPIGLKLFDGTQGGVRRLPVPRRDSFSICHGHTCRYIGVASLSGSQWSRLRASLVNVVDDAKHERAAIGRTIGLMEKMVGPQVGTSGDLAENRTQHGVSGQMDCIDESSNTLTYLRLLTDGGLLNWHHVGARVNRGPHTLVMQAPHSAAGLIETHSGARFAVDSWFGANGEPALVMPLKAWAGGFRPAALNKARGEHGAITRPGGVVRMVN